MFLFCCNYGIVLYFVVTVVFYIFRPSKLRSLSKLSGVFAQLDRRCHTCSEKMCVRWLQKVFACPVARAPRDFPLSRHCVPIRVCCTSGIAYQYGCVAPVPFHTILKIKLFVNPTPHNILDVVYQKALFIKFTHTTD